MKWAILTLALLLSVTSPAATYYVRTNGNDSADGSTGTPWLTVTKAATTATPGDTVIIGPGRFEEYVTLTRSNITYQGTGDASLQGFRVNDAPGNALVALTLRGAQNSLNSHIRVEHDSHDLVVSNCFIGPGVFATDFGMVWDHVSQTVSNASVNWADRGFRTGAVVYGGSSGVAQYQYVNYGYSWTVTNITGNVIGLQPLSGVWAPETNSYTWSPIAAGSTYEGTTGIQFIPGSGYSARGARIIGNTFSNLFGSAFILDLARDVVIQSNLVTRLNSYRLARPSGSNITFIHNRFIDLPSFVFYSNAEKDSFYHPIGGGRVYDYIAGALHTGGGISQNVLFSSNWVENLHNPLGQFDDHPSSTNTVFEFNVFVGIGESFSGGNNGFIFRNNTWLRSSYEPGQSAALTLGSGGITKVQVISNLFLDIGDHTSTNSGFYSVTGSSLVNTNWNLVAAAETLLFGANRNFGETNGLNGVNPWFVDPDNPRGPDGIPFTEDDGLRPMPNSPIALLSWGALAARLLTPNQPLASFRQISTTAWQDATGTNYNTNWYAAPFYSRTNKVRPYGTPETLGTVPFEATFTATNSISSTTSTSTWDGITAFAWNFGDGWTSTGTNPTVAHTYTVPGDYTVSLTVTNTAGNSHTTTRRYRGVGVGPVTYYVSTNGNDSGAGTLEDPWLTVQKGATTATNGQTVQVLEGSFDETVNTANPGVIFDGGGVARVRAFLIDVADTTLRNMTLTGTTNAGGYALWLRDYAHGTIVSNNVLDLEGKTYVNGIVMDADVFSNPADTNAPRGCIIITNTVKNLTGATGISIGGRSNLVTMNTFTNFASCDFMRLFGHTNRVTRNRFIKNHAVVGIGNHVDFMQTFGENQHSSLGHTVDQNWIGDIVEGQLCQLTMVNSFTNLQHGWWTVANNVFTDIGLQGSSGIPGMRWLNNLFNRCTTNSTHVISMAWTSNRNNPEGAIILNNVFVNCGPTNSDNSGWYSVDVTNIWADFNFVSKDGWMPVRTNNPPSAFRWWEANGINGGNPPFTDYDGADYRPATNSFLLNAGTNLAGFFTTDILGNTRSGWTIGPYEEPGEYTPPPQPPTSLRARILRALNLRILE